MKKIITLSILCFSMTQAISETPLIQVVPPVTNASGEHVYFYHGENLTNALTLFSRSNGMKVIFSDDLPQKIKNKSVSGRFAVSSPNQMLQALSDKYGFDWFIYSGVLYITSADRISKSIEVSPDDMPMVRGNLQQIGLLNDKFGYSELRNENKVIVSGPQLYVNMLLDQIRHLDISPASQQFAVYRLRYASATDIQLSFNNQQIVVPGVATILQSLLQGRINSSPVGPNKLMDQVSEPIQNQAKQMLSQRDQSQSSDTSGMTTGTLSTPLIQADSRLNTIIIRDKAYNLKIYKNLIDLLDVPSPLIQVNVMIIHIDQKKLSQAGINWWASGFGNAGGYGAGNLNQGNGPSNNLSYYYGQLNPGQLIVTNIASFASSLNFLQQNQMAQAVGKPSLATTDNLPAIVNVSENLYFGTQQGTNNNNNNNNNNGVANYASAQIVQALQITPHVIYNEATSQNEIKLSIVLQDGSVNQQNNSVYPNTTQSTINSQAVITEGQSILLAGYTRDVAQEDVSKVPFLGDIPLLGWFFKSKTNSVHQIATLYLVTPQIIWQNEMYKLKDYVVVDNNKVNIKNNYQLGPKAGVVDQSVAGTKNQNPNTQIIIPQTKSSPLKKESGTTLYQVESK